MNILFIGGNILIYSIIRYAYINMSIANLLYTLIYYILNIRLVDNL